MSARIRVHWNLHRGGLSVTRGGVVVATPETVCLHDVAFLVSDAQLARMKRLGRRKVVAWVEGVDCGHRCDHAGGVEVTFNPWRSDRFHVRATGETVTRAETCRIESVPAPTKTGNAPRMLCRGLH
jgi:hypothetical protein